MKINVRWVGVLLVVTGAGCAIHGGLAPPVELRQPPEQNDQRMVKEVRWENGETNILYEIDLALRGQEVALSLVVENRGDNPVFLLMDHPWVSEVSANRIATFSIGTDLFTYGNEVPYLTKLDPGREVERTARLALSVPVSDFNSVRVGFFGIFDASPALIQKLSSLEEVQGWWQTGDLELAERFLDTLVFEFVEFSLSPQKAEHIEPRVGIGTQIQPPVPD